MSLFTHLPCLIFNGLCELLHVILPTIHILFQRILDTLFYVSGMIVEA